MGVTAAVPSAPHRPRPFYALFAAQAVAAFGNSLTALAIPWFVLETTGSSARTGITGAAGAIPVILAMAIGGAAVDRFGFRRMSLLSDTLSMLTVAAIPLLHATVGLNFAGLLALVFLGALFDTPGASARSAMQPELAKLAGLTLERANAMGQGVQSVATLLGPTVGAFLIAFVGASNVLWFNATTFAVSLLLVALLVPEVVIPKADEAPQHYLADVVAGWRFLWQNRVVRAIAVTATFINFVFAPMTSVLFPIFVNQETGNVRVLGWMISGFGVGEIVSLLAFGAIGHRLPRRAVLIGSFLVIVIPLGLMALLPPWPVMVAATTAIGLLLGPINPLVGTILQEQVPVAFRGRVFGAVSATAMVAMPLGLASAGFLVDAVGLAAVFAVIAATIGVVATSMVVNPALRDLSPPGVTEPGSTGPSATERPQARADDVAMTEARLD